MCGITGVFVFNEASRSYLSCIDKSIDAINKRGPDANGKFIKENIALGHARLSIIDVSDAAAQPFTDIIGRYTIVFNGEFFNFKKYRDELLTDGIELRSTSDTEVLLYLFIKYGKDVVNKINGFFAFAIYDSEHKTLFVARDRYGVKPLYYVLDENRFVFASEMKALFAFGIDKTIDEVAMFNYFQLNYIPPHLSIFKNVHKLDEGSWVEINSNSNATVNKYYSIPYNNLVSTKISSYEESKSALRSLLDDAVKNRLNSDVPLGAFLSGGIDSSVIVALASKYHDNLHTFSIGYKDEPMFDETNYAELVARKYKTNHTAFKLSNDDLFSNLFEMLDYIDEPFADSSALAVFILSKHTKKHVTVALSGDGADEMFGGYNKHTAEVKARRETLINRGLPHFSSLVNLIPQSRNSFVSNKARQVRRYIDGLKLSSANRYWRWCSFNSDEETQEYFVKSIVSENIEKERIRYTGLIDKVDFNSVLLADMNLVLGGDMLVKVDRMSMANSLEIRNPFLDFRVVDFAFSLPAQFKNDGKISKRILKDTFKTELPEEIFNRGKHGFEVPLLKWLRTDLWDLLDKDLLSEDFIESQGIFNMKKINQLKRQLFSANPGDIHAKIWALLVFQYWWKRYIG